MKGQWLYLVLVLLIVAASVQAQPGFISIDCGIDVDDAYNETIGINYVSDADFIDTGENHILPVGEELNSYRKQFTTVRSFPTGNRNCYTLKPVTKGNKYLIRAYFFYGNYDQQNHPPQFDLYVGVNRWATVSYKGPKEIITVASMEFISICLQNTGFGTPFISSLELRPLKSSLYTDSNDTQSLNLEYRIDAGLTSRAEIRYPYDTNDLLWQPLSGETWTPFSTSSLVRTDKYEDFEPSSEVMMSAVRPTNESNPLYFSWNATDPTLQFHVYRHFAELELLQSNMTREFSVCCGHNCLNAPFRPEYLVRSSVFTTTPLSGQYQYDCSFTRTQKSTLPPILNAIEVYSVLPLSNTTTSAQDVEAIVDIHKYYNLKKIWMGDPCLPKDYPWESLTCSYPDDSTAPAIKSLNLSSSGLTGEIAAVFAKLTSIETLDLSGNNLSGPIPGFLGDSKSLSLLNLSGNQLNGSIPSTLQERSNKRLLKLIVDNNPNLCQSDACNTHKNKLKNVIVPILASVGSAVVILLILMSVRWILKQRNQDAVAKDYNKPYRFKGGNSSLRTENRWFTFAEVVNMTNNFERTLGKGGFGTVYYGQMIDGTPVAVKMLSLSSIKLLSHPCQGPDEFHNEAQLLKRVHHRNLVTFFGYCHEGDSMVLVYEYMSEGNLANHLSGGIGNKEMLRWNQRLRVALDVAHGLEYLHNGCKPPIIHRDMKTTNILLNEKLEAKIGDFGLSKEFANEKFSHISTGVKGTHGYLDPDYCFSQNLTEKSDVYSFGVILLELITGQPAIIKISDSERRALISWVNSMVAEGDIRRMIDPRLVGNYNINSVWKAVEIALACTQTRSIDRPMMSDVVTELKGCLETEIDFDERRSEQGETSSMLSYYALPR